MTNKLTSFQLTLYSLGFLMLFGAWVYLLYYPPTEGSGPMVTYIIGALNLLAGHILGTAGNAPAPAPAPIAPPVPPGQGGFATLHVIIALLLIGVIGTLMGCSSLQQAGNTAYTVEPVAGPDGKTTFKFSATDGKEYSSRTISVIQDGGGGYAIQVQEGASTAFQGQAIAEKGLSILPSFAPVLLPPGPAALGVVKP